jgi:hypothetical protein
MICTNFNRNWPAGSGEKDLKKFAKYSCYFATISLEIIEFSFPKDDLFYINYFIENDF